MLISSINPLNRIILDIHPMTIIAPLEGAPNKVKIMSMLNLKEGIDNLYDYENLCIFLVYQNALKIVSCQDIENQRAALPSVYELSFSFAHSAESTLTLFRDYFPNLVNINTDKYQIITHNDCIYLPSCLYAHHLYDFTEAT